MPRLLYIGNKLSAAGKTPTSVEVLGALLSEEGYEVIAVSPYRNQLLRLLHMLWSVVRFARTLDWVLIDTYSTRNFYYAWLVAETCQMFKLNYLPILHGGKLPWRLKSNPILCHRMFKKAFVNVAPSGYLYEAFRLHYNNVVCIPNSIDLKLYSFLNKTFEVPRILWVRSFAAIYNPMLAVEAFAEIQSKYPKASLSMVGPDKDGSLKQCQARAHQLGLEITFTGKLSKQEWIQYSTGFNICLNTTNYDNTPVSLIEAMALGLVVISTKVGGIPFLIQDKLDGLLVNPDSKGEILQAVELILTDKSLQKKILHNARLKAETMDWNRIKLMWNAVLIDKNVNFDDELLT
ncbi:MAG: glycosyltransferase family 4 protein [Flavobacteriaceae bacterium]|nr:glycosyltransferase family 4 protein [Flavobacteriaceae bacterium]